MTFDFFRKVSKIAIAVHYLDSDKRQKKKKTTNNQQLNKGHWSQKDLKVKVIASGLVDITVTESVVNIEGQVRRGGRGGAFFICICFDKLRFHSNNLPERWNWVKPTEYGRIFLVDLPYDTSLRSHTKKNLLNTACVKLNVYRLHEKSFSFGYQ